MTEVLWLYKEICEAIGGGGGVDAQVSLHFPGGKWVA